MAMPVLSIKVGQVSFFESGPPLEILMLQYEINSYLFAFWMLDE